jgi:hypothetical protein
MQLKGCFGGLLVLVGLLQKTHFCSTLNRASKALGRIKRVRVIGMQVCFF